MPGPVSDSFDPEFTTASNANDVVAAMDRVREKITRLVGAEEVEPIVSVVHGRSGRRVGLYLNERELRVLRFAIDRAKETI